MRQYPVRRAADWSYALTEWHSGPPLQNAAIPIARADGAKLWVRTNGYFPRRAGAGVLRPRAKRDCDSTQEYSIERHQRYRLFFQLTRMTESARIQRAGCTPRRMRGRSIRTPELMQAGCFCPQMPLWVGRLPSRIPGTRR